MSKGFDISTDSVVVTSTYVVKDNMPILYVAHEMDEENEPLWQFHCGNGDYDMEKMLLVSLDNILELDPSLSELAKLPLGSVARRASENAGWEYFKE